MVLAEDEPAILTALEEVLAAEGFETVGCPDGLTALLEARRRTPDLMVLDINMPRLAGTDVALLLRMVEARAETRILIISGREDWRTRRLIRDSGADAFILKPFDVTTFRGAVSHLMSMPGRPWLEARDWYTLEDAFPESRLPARPEAPGDAGCTEVERALGTTISMLARSVDERGAHQPYHNIQVAGLALMLAEVLQMAAGERRALRLAALAHDAALALLPDDIVARTGPLEPGELHRIREHPVTMARLFDRVPGGEVVASWVRHHHERWDGGGYPDGLAGDSIPLGARILGLVDAYAAMTTRSYRTPLSPGDAAAELRRCAGSQFDPALVEAFIRVTHLEDPAER